ncbi:nitrate reductase molybdenum cofactor assembly chaperone [Sinomonas terrae]|uniref:Nitrate reductase molybdenum cofactor assembly chaperone n=1 Tax=Sinomonas terrae TaxID=2908838 RepID=A0ABS9TYP2_9MICC|nr:nitrate reductase molybdenum cofactor assembly chaperone [Sinomonas terrae]MCH6469287.1 nitrate reductase molybdenum cofactor assembly chaperone [Sinomonas terrae]
MARRADDLRERVVYAAAAVLLDYPDERVRDRLPSVRAALAEHPGPLPRLLETTAAQLMADDGETSCARYVETFDLSRRHALHLSYWTDGDTRRRGQTLATFKQRYRDCGWVVNLGGELPDFLPLVLEFTSRVDPAVGRSLLLEYRASLELLRLELAADSSIYSPVLEAVCGSLPGPSPTSRAEAMALAGPPREQVGLEAFDPKLLPLSEISPPHPAPVKGTR